ncbi:hypothetical protein Dsin_020458 [Dipteronia sinensis]|uniref:DUF674 family protein n=1 Tax=Dipteronia sinensis TaxID=43782 RepID=A0AAE0E3I4_9ROSI|nr:hypothetical protein Dsin_020458 [Dipteronia sinensis]
MQSLCSRAVGPCIRLKASVNKENNRVIFVESDEDFIDVLFSFFTMPMGTIIKLIRNESPTAGIGCMDNLYKSIMNLDGQQFRTEACKTMLLHPRNTAEVECKRLKLNIDDSEPLKYFVCNKRYYCRLSGEKLLSHYRNAVCGCGEHMGFEMVLSKEESEGSVFDARDRGVFLKGLTRFIITDALEVMPASVESSHSLLYALQVTDGKIIEEHSFYMGVDKVLTLLNHSLVAEAVLTKTLLEQNPEPELGKEDFCCGRYTKSRMTPVSNTCGEGICVKLTVSKSKNIVCYAEASEDFVDLLFSFLTVPLGHIVKKMCNAFGGCITYLYRSVEKLDAEQFLKSSKHKEMLLSPKLPPDFSYENHPLSIEEDIHPPYYYESYYINRERVVELKSHESSTHFGGPSTLMTVMDPKSHFKEATSGGFLTGPAKFTVTDNLIVTPISPVSCLSLLNTLEVPLNDVKECVVHVGYEEAFKLLLASFESESALTNTFLRESNP